MDRRSFLAVVIAGPAVMAKPAVMAGADRLDKIGLQLYTVRDAMRASVERTLYEVGRIGYEEVEFAGYFNRPPRAIRQLLDRNGLRAPAAHVPVETLRAGWYRALNDAAEVGHKWLVVPSLPEADRNSLDALKRTAELFNRSAADAKSYKIKVGFHNHDTEFREVEGRRILDVLLEETDTEMVDFEMDLYWVTKAGGDPLDYFRRFPGRFALSHVKDSAGPPDHRMTEVGGGTIDFGKIFAARKEAGMKHCFVEHDNPADPMTSIRASYRYLDDLTF